LAIWLATTRERSITLAKVEADILHRETERLGFLEFLVKFGALEQSLGRDAAPVEAGAAGRSNSMHATFLPNWPARIAPRSPPARRR